MNRILLFFCLILLILGNSFAGEIHGHVYLVKQGKQAPVAKTPVRLHIYKDDYEFSGIETTTNSSGEYSFHDLNTSSQFGYLAYPVYQGLNYPYEEIVFPNSSKSVKKDFVLSESTGSNKDLSVDESIFFEFGKKDVWKVTHEIIIRNIGDHFYHPDRTDAQPVQFSLFEGGFDLSLMDGITRENSKIDDVKDTLQVFLTLAPQQSTKLRFSYFYSPDKRRVTFNRPAYLQRSNVSLFFNKHIRLFSNEFQPDMMMLRTQTGYKNAYTSGPIAQNENIRYEISGFYLERDFLHALMLIACLILTGLMIFISIRYQKLEKDDKELAKGMRQYLIELKKHHAAKLIDDQYYKTESYRVCNFLFQFSKRKK